MVPHCQEAYDKNEQNADDRGNIRRNSSMLEPEIEQAAGHACQCIDLFTENKRNMIQQNIPDDPPKLAVMVPRAMHTLR